MSVGARRTVVFVGIVALALLIWQIAGVLLLAFVGILLAVFLAGLAKRLSAHTPLSRGWALAAVLFVIAGILVLTVVLLGPRIASQVQQLVEALPDSIDQVEQNVRQTGWGQFVLDQGGSSNGGLRFGSDVFSRLTGAASSALGGIMDVVLILFAAIFFAIDPQLYRNGLVLLVPKNKESRMEEGIDAAGEALWKWLMGKFVAMLFVGVSVGIGLALLGVPLALTLGILAGLFDFVPFIGPIFAAVPGILLALTVGPSQALYAALIYLVAQQIEGNVVTPLVQRKAVSLPPVLVLFAVLAGGVLFGVLGMLIATPLAVVTMVFVSMFYVEDALGKTVSVPGRT